MIVYERLVAFTQATKFKFKDYHKMYIGAEIANLWRSQGGKMEDLDVIQSVESNGTWMVYNYPQAFVPEMDKIIANFAQRALRPNIKKITEKPSTNNLVPIKTASSDPPQKEISKNGNENRKRTRKPVPIYTTRKK